VTVPAKQVNVRVPRGLHADAKALAAEQGLTVSELMREGLEQLLAAACPTCKGTGRRR